MERRIEEERERGNEGLYDGDVMTNVRFLAGKFHRGTGDLSEFRFPFPPLLTSSLSQCHSSYLQVGMLIYMVLYNNNVLPPQHYSR